MCGRYSLSKPENIQKRFKTQNEAPTSLRSRFFAKGDKLPTFEPSYNIAPSQTLPVITRNSPNKITMMRWGFAWSKDTSSGTINIRCETTREKLYFKRILLNQRCIVPSDGFYEWKSINLEGLRSPTLGSESSDEKHPFYIYNKDHVLFGFAGLYNTFKDAEGKPIYTFAIITCPPNNIVKTVHHRMPVILEEKDEDKWLDPQNDDFEKLYKILKPYPPENIKFHPVNKKVNNPRNDDESLQAPFVY